MKKYVYIQSELNIMVTKDLDFNDFTRKDSDVPNRMRISPIWSRLTVMIKQGQHLYPAEIAEWKTVKSLVEAGKMTIGTYTDSGDENVLNQSEELEKNKQRILEEKKTKSTSKKTGTSLEDAVK